MQNKWFCFRLTSEGEAVLFSTPPAPFWLRASICTMKLLICLNLLLKQFTIKSISSQNTQPAFPFWFPIITADWNLMRFHTSHLEFIFVPQPAMVGASRTLWGIFFRFCTRVDSDSRMNWRDLGGQRSPQPHVWWTRHLNNAWGEFLHFFLDSWLNWLHFGGGRHCDAACCESSISGAFSGSFFKFGTNLSDELIIDGQRSSSKNLLRAIFQKCTEGFLSYLAQTYRWTRGWADRILKVKIISFCTIL